MVPGGQVGSRQKHNVRPCMPAVAGCLDQSVAQAETPSHAQSPVISPGSLNGATTRLLRRTTGILAFTVREEKAAGERTLGRPGSGICQLGWTVELMNSVSIFYN